MPRSGAGPIRRPGPESPAGIDAGQEVIRVLASRVESDAERPAPTDESHPIRPIEPVTRAAAVALVRALEVFDPPAARRAGPRGGPAERRGATPRRRDRGANVNDPLRGPLGDPPPRLHERGRFAFGRYRAPIDDPAIPLGPFGRLRQKEWHYTAVTTETHYVAVAVVQLGYAANAFAYAVDRRDPSRFQRSRRP